MGKKLSPIERLKNLVSTNDLFSSKELEDACRDFLLERDYKVLEPLPNDLKVTKLQDLCNLFYALSSRKYFGKYANLGRGHKFDMVIMRNFVNSRMKEGVSRRNALIECANIIVTVFENADNIGITGQITINMFDPGLFSWVVDKALCIINGKIKYNEDRYVDDLVDKACESVDDSWAMFSEGVTNGSQEK